MECFLEYIIPKEISVEVSDEKIFIMFFHPKILGKIELEFLSIKCVRVQRFD